MVDGLVRLGHADLAEKPTNEQARGNEPPLTEPVVGNPISHGQVVDLWKKLQSSQPSPCSLETLLQGSRVYVPPPPPKPEPVRPLAPS